MIILVDHGASSASLTNGTAGMAKTTTLLPLRHSRAASRLRSRSRRSSRVGSRSGSRSGIRIRSLVQPKERNNLIRLDGNVVRHTLRRNRLHIRAVDAPGPPIERGVVLGGSGGGAETEHVGPLLNTLAVVVVVEDLVVGAMPELHLGAGTGVPGVGVAHEVAPLSGGLDGLTIGAGRVPHAGAGKAGEGDTGKGGDTGEDVRVGASEDLRHHGAGGGSGCEDTRGIAGVRGEGVLHHVDNSEGITAAVVSESGGGVDVPAVAGVGGIGVDDNWIC